MNPDLAIAAAKSCLEFSRRDFTSYIEIGLAALSGHCTDSALVFKMWLKFMQELLTLAVEAGGIKYANDINKILLPQITSSSFQQMYSDATAGIKSFILAISWRR